MRDFSKPCQHCGANSIETIIPSGLEIRKNLPYLKDIPEYCCKSCLIEAQINYIKGVPFENIPLLLNQWWIYPEGMNQIINERLGIYEH